MRPLLRIAVLMLGIAAAFESSTPHPAFGHLLPADAGRRGTRLVPPRPAQRGEGPRSGGEGLIIPVDGVRPNELRPMFHEARAGHEHQALDILAPRGTRVFAAVDGTIRKLFTSRAGGLTIYEFDGDQKRVFYYAHLDHYADIHEGMHVRQGDTIGFVGTTGNAPANTPHLHFAIEMAPPTREWWKGVAIDPYPLLTRN